MHLPDTEESISSSLIIPTFKIYLFKPLFITIFVLNIDNNK